MLVDPDQFRLLEHVSGHRPLEVGLGCLAKIAELGVERVELEEVSVPSLRWTRTGITGLSAVVEPFAAAVVKTDCRLRYVIDDPMHKGALRRGGIRASGSSAMRAKLRVAAGAPLQASGGAVPGPSQV